MNWIGDTPFKELGMIEEFMVLMKELAEDNDYWKSALSFILQVKDRKPSSLTVNQKNWVADIIATLSVELSKRTAKDLFGPVKPMTNEEIQSVIKDGGKFW